MISKTYIRSGHFLYRIDNSVVIMKKIDMIKRYGSRRMKRIVDFHTKNNDPASALDDIKQARRIMRELIRQGR